MDVSQVKAGPDNNYLDGPQVKPRQVNPYAQQRAYKRLAEKYPRLYRRLYQEERKRIIEERGSA